MMMEQDQEREKAFTSAIVTSGQEAIAVGVLTTSSGLGEELDTCAIPRYLEAPRQAHELRVYLNQGSSTAYSQP